MAEIVQSITRVTDIMSEIAAASVEQTAGIEQINMAIAQMDEVTQQNAALVEKAAAAAGSLQDQASSLGQVVVGDNFVQPSAVRFFPNGHAYILPWLLLVGRQRPLQAARIIG